jgi:sortase A
MDRQGKQALVGYGELLLGLIFLLTMSACSELIIITPISTPTPSEADTSSAIAGAVATAVEGMPRRLVIDTISLDAPVIEMGWEVVENNGQLTSVWNVPVDEAGWHLNSARPGQGSNVVISGHNNSTGGHIFGQLEEAEVGDQITVWIDEDTAFEYQISETQVVRAFNASEENLDYLRRVMQPTDTEQLTLITCWPSWTNTHRLIIIARPL